VAEVLVVEDEDLTRRLLEARLESAGHLVRSAASVAEAQDLLARFGCPDVLISDMFMPGGSGLLLVTQVRADPESAGLPVIFLSGRALPGDVDATRALGASYLTKPFSLDALSGAIGAALQPVDAAVELTVRARLAAFGRLDEHEQELIAELLAAFVQRAPAVQSAVEWATAARDPEALQSSARRLKAAALNLGAEALAGVCTDLQARADRADFPIPVTVTSRFRRVLGASCRVFAELAAELQREPMGEDLVGAAQA
jgi:CheY-like chemotaxis protein